MHKSLHCHKVKRLVINLIMEKKIMDKVLPMKGGGEIGANLLFPGEKIISG